MTMMGRSITARSKRSKAFSINRIVKFDDRFLASFGYRALRPASRLLLYIAANGAISVKQALLDSELSYRAFYIMINKLKAQQLISVEADLHDRRIHRLVLAKRFSQFSERP